MGNSGVKIASLSELERAVEHVNALCSSGVTLGGVERRLFYGLRVALRLRGNQHTSKRLRVLWRTQFVRVIITPIASPPPISAAAHSHARDGHNTALAGSLAPKIATVAQFEELYTMLVRAREGIVLGRHRCPTAPIGRPAGLSASGGTAAVADPGSSAGNDGFDATQCRSVASAGAELLRDAFWRGDAAADAAGDCAAASKSSTGPGDISAAGTGVTAGSSDADAGAGAGAGSDAAASGECDDDEYPETECPICFDNVVEIVLPCSHSFCRQCATEWQRSAPTGGCPLCRGESGGGSIPAEWELTEPEEVLNATASHMGDLARAADTLVRSLPAVTVDDSDS